MTSLPPSGVLLVDKPSGMTSARAVASVKRLLPGKTKVGHTGTLDPLASGLLVMLVGRATRLSRYVGDLSKSYTATARFGATSDTLDSEGEISCLEDAPRPTRESILRALPRFTGEVSQIPPMASALKVGGERLYTLHRKGMEVERESRRVLVETFDLLDLDGQDASFSITCGGGTYVRTLVADLAASLDSGAYLTTLRRTSVGPFDVTEAASPDSNEICSRIIQPTRLLGELPVREADVDCARRVSNGREIPSPGLSGRFRVQREGELLAVYVGDGGVGRAEVVLWAG